jgi:hypothetical protein
MHRTGGRAILVRVENHRTPSYSMDSWASIQDIGQGGRGYPIRTEMRRHHAEAIAALLGNLEQMVET